MLLKLTFKYCQYANAIAHFVRCIKEIQIYYWIYFTMTESKVYIPKVINYFTETVPRFTMDDFQFMSFPIEQLALEVVIMV
jgi:hypothetical protein